ncbi:MAG: hypothetical protein AB1697_04935 [Pseudomonadota bacterium]
MEKGTIGIIAAGLAAVWLYLSFSQTQDAERQTQTARHERDVAEFDLTFNQVLTGQDSPELKARVEETNARFKKAREAQEVVQAEQSEKQKILQGEVETDMKKGGVDLTGDAAARAARIKELANQ